VVCLKKPVAGVPVSIKQQTGPQQWANLGTVTTDKEGLAKANLKEGSYLFEVNQQGYQPYRGVGRMTGNEGRTIISLVPTTTTPPGTEPGQTPDTKKPTRPKKKSLLNQATDGTTKPTSELK